jgi:membrane protein implicated in regulation of membrane protease activity
MTLLFLICAVVGGTVLVCQFVLTLVGMGADVEIADDMDLPDSDGSHVDSSWLFGVISFRTLVAAATFFGLAGLATESAGQGRGVQLLIASVAGLSAMYGVHWIVQAMGRLAQDGTLRITAAVGREATVYVPIPAKHSHAGKVQLKVQNRLVEYEAVTGHAERLSTGTKVRVVGISGNTLEVEPLLATAPATPLKPSADTVAS